MERLVEVEYVGPNHYQTLDGRWEMRKYPSGVGPANALQGWRLRLDGDPDSDTIHKSLLHARIHVGVLEKNDLVPEKP